MQTEKNLIPVPKTHFLKVKCGCGNEQTIFNAATTKVKCLACGTPLAQTTSSRIKLKAKVLKELN